MAAVLNTINFKKKLDGLMQSKQMVGLAKNAANTRFTFAKQELLEEYDNNEIVKELRESAANPSIQGSSIVSKGNIFSFLGFNKGEKPAEELKSYLNQNITMDNNAKIEISGNKVKFGFKVNFPTKSSINDNFPTADNWSSRSWVDIIENGISGALKKFIFWSETFKSGASRSTTGLQSTGKVSNITVFSPKKFLTELFENFRNKF